MINIHFTITEAEYLEAQDLFTREQNKKMRTWLWLISGASFLIGLFSLLASPRPISLATIPSYAIPMMVMGGLPLYIKPAVKRAMKKRFPKEVKNLTNATVQLDDTGYRTSIPGVGEGTADWRGISQWFEGDKVFVLRSGLLMRIVPKSALDDSERSELRSLLSEKIGPVGVTR
jgi:hypothetical protein